jgi:Fe-S cluster assembly iron-binding protein IscA
MAFQMTEAAAREILEAATRSGAEGVALRIAAKTTDGGVAFGMGFDEQAPGDQVSQFGALTVLIAETSRDLLDAAVLDFGEVEGGGQDFIFSEAP